MVVRKKHMAVRHRLRVQFLHLWDRTAMLWDRTAIRQGLRARIPQLGDCTAVLYWHTAVSEGLRAWPTDHVALYRP